MGRLWQIFFDASANVWDHPLRPDMSPRSSNLVLQMSFVCFQKLLFQDVALSHVLGLTLVGQICKP